MSQCNVEKCDRPIRAKGLCGYHYRKNWVAENIDSKPYLQPIPKEKWKRKTSSNPRPKETSEHHAWRDMKERCYNPNNKSYKWYGARGIKIHDRWLYSFEFFIKDVGLKPNPKLTLDRINNDGNYEPGNVRWADWVTQANNKRLRHK